MKLIFALGNPDSKYDGTRHNTGFVALDTFASEQDIGFTDRPKFHAQVAELQIEGEKVILVKPQTFYNEVGRSYRAVLDFYKIFPSDTLIVHDELALPFGTVRSRVGGSDAGNNGIKSINLHGGELSARVRIGISNDKRSVMGDVDFVLARFSKDEHEDLVSAVLPVVGKMIRDFIADSHTVTSHRVVDNNLAE